MMTGCVVRPPCSSHLLIWGSEMTGKRYMRHRLGGFTLIEMMVAMLLGILILLAVSEVFVNNSRTRIEIENTSRQIDNGRYAMQLLESELANAGFFGEWSGSPALAVGAPIEPACVSGGDDVKKSVSVPIFGENNVAAGSAPACLNAFKAGNDYVAVRRSSTCAAGDDGCDDFSSGSSGYHLQVSACQTGVPASGALVMGTSSVELKATQRDCEAPAPIYRFLSRLYYVNSNDVLVRAELLPTGYQSTSLVEGIERLHFEYGLDSSGDGEVDTYESTPVGAEWADVVAVKIWLLARNLEATPGYADNRSYVLGGEADYAPADNFKRQLYTGIVRLNNVAGRREVP